MNLGTEEAVHAGGLEWNVATAGPDDGPPALLLHGFPEHWRSWRKQIAPFTAAGMRVFAADLPGYAGTDAPTGYSLETLAGHVAGLADHIGDGPVHLVGHDWGGILAHAVAALHPESVRSLVVASAPHPDVTTRALRDIKQIGKSWYVVLFTIPLIEYVVGTNLIVDRIFGGASAGVHDRADMARALSYYKANLAPWKIGRHPVGRISVPALVVHGERDNYIGSNLMDATCEMFDDLRGYETLDAGHYLHREKPDDFNAAVIGFWRDLGPSPRPDPRPQRSPRR